MFAVVGCRHCHALWVVEGRPDATSCRRCGTRYRYDRLERFATAETAAAAKEARSRLLQDRGDGGTDLDDFAALEAEAMDAGMSDEEFLAASGLDADEVADAGDDPAPASDSRSRREVVLDGLRDLDSPTAKALRAYAGENGVDPDYVDRALRKLRERGEVSESGGHYRLL